MIRDIDINKVVVSNKFPLGKEDFKYFNGYKKPGKNRHLCIIHPPKIIYKKMVMKIDVYLFFNKRRKSFIKSVEMLEKDSKNIKKVNSDFIYSKKYLKTEKISTQKEDFNVYMHQ